MSDTERPYPPVDEHIVLRSDVGMLEQHSLEERIRRAEHYAGRLEINAPGRRSHCWLCRRAWEEAEDAKRRSY
jgi:hypothetical protein